MVAVVVAIACNGTVIAPEASPTPEPTPGLSADVAAVCTPRDLREPTRHRSGTPPRTTQEALRRRFCSLEVSIAGSSTNEAEWGPRVFNFRLMRAPLSQFPGIVDSNSPAFWTGETLAIFNSAWEQTYRSSGTDVENLADPLLIELPRPARPGIVWLEAVWRDADGTLYGWYHQEPSDFECQTAPIIGAAVSFDDGLTWEDRGTVIESAYPVDCSYSNGYFVGGTGDFSVIAGPQGQHLFFLFSNYAGPSEEQGVAVARGRLADLGQPGSVTKYYRGQWNEPGVGGKAQALLRSSTGWRGPHVEAFWGPSVHWNTYLGMYVALLNHTEGENWAQEGVYVAFSNDLLNWTYPRKILDSNDWYPQAMGLGEGETDSLAGQTLRIYVGGISRLILQFELSQL
jgi:hypothetical protein